MGVSGYNDLIRHVGHEIKCVVYGEKQNVAVECLTCNEVLMDFDKPTEKTEEEAICDLRKIAYGLQACLDCPVSCAVNQDNLNRLSNVESELEMLQSPSEKADKPLSEQTTEKTLTVKMKGDIKEINSFCGEVGEISNKYNIETQFL